MIREKGEEGMETGLKKRVEPRQRKVALIDLDTGEVLDGVPTLMGKKLNLGTDWCMTIQAKLSEMARDEDMTGEAWRVMAYMMGRMDFENWMRLPLKDVAVELNMKRPNVSRAVQLLVTKGLVERSAVQVGKSSLFRISHTVAWRGRVSNWIARDREVKAREKRAVEIAKRQEELGLNLVKNQTE